MRKLYYSLLALFLFQGVAVGQSYYFRHYQVENGLSNNAVICSVQDKAGFLWFGTKDGLNRFDGYSFKVFRSNPDEKGSIGSNFIYALYEDGKGNLWIGTGKGLYKYNALSESFQLIPATDGFAVSEIMADKEGKLWFTNGLTLYQYEEKSNRLFPFSPDLFFETSSVCASPAGDIWAATSGGLLKKYNPATNSFTSFDVFSKSKPAASKWIEKIQFTGQGDILVGTGTAGAKIFNTQTAIYQDLPMQKDGKTDLFVRSFLETGKGELWIGTESGIFIYNSKTGKTTSLQKKYNDPYSLSDNAVYTFCRDKEGGIWSGTYFGGINYYTSQNTAFKKYIPKIGENSLSGNVVREIARDKRNNLWIGTEDAGLNKWDAATGKFVHFQPTGERGSISYSNIHGLLVTGDELWIGTFEHGLDVMNVRTGRVVRHYSSATNKALKSNFIYTIHQTRDGEIYIGTTIGIYRYNRSTDDFEPLSDMPLYNWYTSIVKDAGGTIWTGTYGNGVNYYDTRTGKVGNLRYIANDKTSISSDRINAIYEDSEKNLWFATEDGLCKWNRDTRNFRRYTSANGFPSNFIVSILEDERKQLWISTTKGLVAFNPKTEKLQIYTIANGLLSDQFNFSSAFKEEDGKMYFGSAKGLVSFYPSAFSRNTFTPPVYITGFQVDNKEVHISNVNSPLKKAITFSKKITLAHHQSTFSIDFAALSFMAPEMLEYAYQMEGLSSKWIYLKKNRKIYFTELAPNTYVFKIKATNSSGVWSEKETRLVIQILPPWWRSWWAYTIYASLFLVVVAFLIRNYHRKMQDKAKRNLELLEIAKEKELYHAKMEFFTNVAHEIRTPLTLIKGPLEKVCRKAGGIQEIQNSLRIMDRNTNRLIELTNQLLDFRETETNGFSLSFVKTNVSDLLEETYQSFAALAEQKNIHLAIQLPPDPLYAYVDKEAFHKIVYNLFSNAVKYADSRVHIQLYSLPKPETSFSIQLKNDGHLIPVSLKEKIFEPFYRIRGTEKEKEKGTGIGLALSRSLTQLHKGTLLLEEPEEGLNVFVLTLPVHQEIEFTLSGQLRRKDSTLPTKF